MQKFKELYAFVDAAVKSRKYPESTAQGLRAALKLFEAELNDEEIDSLDLVIKNLEQIYQSVCTKNMQKFSASSLATYKSRVLKVLGDFKNYGINPTKMSNWTPKTILRTKNSKTNSNKKSNSSFSGEYSSEQIFVSSEMHRIELSLRPDTKFTVVVPRDIKQSEADTVKTILDSLVSHEQPPA